MEVLHLTPKKIIDNLKRIEQALKHEELNLYTPSIIHKLSPLDNNILGAETRCMLEFVGLNDYNIDVKFDTLPNNVGGCITSPNNTTEKAVHISVSDKYRGKWENCIAILAHEICHKLLAVYGLYEEDVELNETLVDLATIYVGFGTLILNGYTTDSNKQIIGYLDLDNYKVALHIVSIVYGKASLDSTGLADVDFLMDETLNFWVNAESEIDLMRKCFTESEREIAVFYRNLILLEQLIMICKTNITNEFAKYDNIFFKGLIQKENHYINKLNALGILYDMTARGNFPQHKTTPFWEKTSDVLSSSIYDLLKQCQTNYSIDLRYDFECPCCGTKMKNNGKIVNRNAILRCPHCGSHYFFVGEEINFSKRQRELKDLRNKENAIVEERVAKRVAERSNEIRKNADERIHSIYRKTQEIIDNNNLSMGRVRKEAERKIADIRINEQNEYKQRVKSRIPFYLRWLVNKYL